MKYDYLIVGSGLFGAVCAERLASFGEKVLVLERRDHIGGNCWSEIDSDTGIEVHKYGSHIFHTSKQRVWDYVTQFTKFNRYRHTVWSTYQNQVYPMPINLATINSYYGLNLKPYEVKGFLEEERRKEVYENPKNLEEQAISLIGRSLYEVFIRGYTIKQWGKDPTELPAEIITRLPVRYNYNNNYFSDVYEGIPLEGYGKLFERFLDHPNITVQLNTDWFEVRERFVSNIFIIYTGPIDQFFDYKHGRLEWRSVEFEREIYSVSDVQGCSVMNYPDAAVPYTRIHEFKHYHPERSETGNTLVYKEYSKNISGVVEPYYPINTSRNMQILSKYRIDADELKNIWLGGRLGCYRYFDMDDTIEAALRLIENIK